MFSDVLPLASRQWNQMPAAEKDKLVAEYKREKEAYEIK